MSLPAPRKLPDQYDRRALEQAFQDLYTALSNRLPYVQFDLLAAEPEKVIADMVVNANGTTWDPGSGAGLYRRNKFNTTWIFLG